MPKLYLSYIANAALFALWMSDHKVNARNKKKYDEVCELNDRLMLHADLCKAQVDYLLTLINKPVSELDEFDKIALHNLNFSIKEKKE
jgi:hypothetical protein